MTPGAIEKLREALERFQQAATYHDGRMVTVSARPTDTLIDAVVFVLRESAAPCVECERRGVEALEKAAQVAEDFRRRLLTTEGRFLQCGPAEWFPADAWHGEWPDLPLDIAAAIRALGSEDKNTTQEGA